MKCSDWEFALPGLLFDVSRNERRENNISLGKHPICGKNEVFYLGEKKYLKALLKAG